LDGKQRALALLGDPRPERATATVQLKKAGEPISGLPVSAMTHDQRELVEKVPTFAVPAEGQDEAAHPASGGVEVSPCIL
jgi:hypothetical protein